MSKNLDDCKKEILNDISRTISFRLCSIGIDLGLFEDLSTNGPSSSEEIASRKNITKDISENGFMEFQKLVTLILIGKLEKLQLMIIIVNYLLVKVERILSKVFSK